MTSPSTFQELQQELQQSRQRELVLQQGKEQLQDEISRLRLLVEQSRDGIVILDQNGKVFETNKRYADMLGYTLPEMLRLHVWDWDFRFEKEQILEMIRQIDASGAHFETQQKRKDGKIIDVELSNNGALYRGEKLIFCVCRDITERKQAERERERLLGELQQALAEIKSLRGILPICLYCKKIRDDSGYWEQLEVYIKEHSNADFSHGLCPECAEKHFPDYFNGVGLKRK